MSGGNLRGSISFNYVRRKFKWGISLLYLGCYRSNHGINIYISHEISIEHPSVGLASLAQLMICLIKCLLIFQDSYIRKGDMTTFLSWKHCMV